MPTVRRYLEAARDVAVDAVTWTPGQPTRENTYRVARTLHGRTAGLSSRVGLRMVTTLRERAPRLTAADLQPSWAQALAELDADGIAIVPPALDADAVARIREFAATAPAVLRSVTGNSRRGTLQDRDKHTAAVHVVESFVLDQPDIQGLIADHDLRRLASAHFSARPVIHPPSLYWTCAGAQVTDDERRRGARQFHWDYDGLGGLRVHVYLTDVDAGAAPMSYVSGSHRVGSLGSSALRVGDMGVPDDALWSAFPRSAVRTITGPAGMMFVSDSQGLHSGTDAVTRDRLFLVMPIQASGFAGYQLRPRAVRPRHPGFVRDLEMQTPELMFFRDRDAVRG